MAVVPVSRALRDDPWALKRWYKQHGVTVAFHAPSYLRVSKQTPFDGLRILITGGEAPNHDDAQAPCQPCRLLERVWSYRDLHLRLRGTGLRCTPISCRPLAVGRPLANTLISIRRDNGDPAPPGVLGEVWLGGAGLGARLSEQPRPYGSDASSRRRKGGSIARAIWAVGRKMAGWSWRDASTTRLNCMGSGGTGRDRTGARFPPDAVEEAVTLVEASANDTKVLRAFVRLRPWAAMPADDEWRGYLGELFALCTWFRLR